MAKAAKKVSQVAAHLAIGFAITYAVSGSVVVGGLAILIEPVINVLLLPLHERLWERLRARATAKATLAIAAEKLSQTGLHMGVAFGVMYGMTGSLALGGLVALLEPICNVLLLPLHDRAWGHASARLGIA